MVNPTMADGIKGGRWEPKKKKKKQKEGEVERKRRKNREKERTYRKLERYKW